MVPILLDHEREEIRRLIGPILDFPGLDRLDILRTRHRGVPADLLQVQVNVSDLLGSRPPLVKKTRQPGAPPTSVAPARTAP